MARIGVIGTGHIAAPMVRFLARKGHSLTVTRRGETVSAALVASHGVDVAEPQDVLDCSEVILLCLRPQVAEAVLGPLVFQPQHKIVSVMAGIPRGTLETLCAPAPIFVQTIPLGFLEQGGCPLAAYGDTGLLAELFAPENPVTPVASEAGLNAHFAICAMVPGLLDLMVTATGWLGARTGDTEAAEAYVGGLVAGFLNTLPDGLAEARDALATPGTLSLQMTEALFEGGAHGALEDGLNAIGEQLA